MFLQKSKAPDEHSNVKLVAYTIILYVSSLFVPFVVVAAYQSLVYYERTQWFFVTPFESYIAFMVGMLYIAVILTIFLIFKEKWNKKVFKWVLSILYLLSIPVFIFSSTTYYYFDDKGIHSNELTSLKEKEYKWEDLSSLHIVYRNHLGTTNYYQYKFKMKNGEIITIPFDNKLSDNRFRVNAVVKFFKVSVTDNIDNPIVD